MIDLALHELHQSLGGRLAQVGGMTAVDHYGDPAGEYAALRQTAGALDLSFRGRLCLTGADRQRFLNGQVTNNVKDLAAGQGCYAAILNHKGKLQGDANIHALANELLLDFEPGQVEAVTQRLEKHIIADDVRIVNVSPHYGLLSIQGPKASEALADCGLGVAPPASEFQSVTVNHATLGEICMVNLPRTVPLAPTGGEGRGEGAPSKQRYGFDLFVPVQSLGAVWTQLLRGVSRVGGRACGWQALETARIEGGIPRFGVDMDETNLAPEAGIEARAISHNKGCYTGQEVIARIRTYGQVAKALKRLRLGATQVLPKKGDKVLKGDKEIGYVTSAVFSPTLKSTVALAYVRREHNRPGTEAVVRAGGANIPAVIL
jgi:folate-binding protein YgfZ